MKIGKKEFVEEFRNQSSTSSLLRKIPSYIESAEIYDIFMGIIRSNMRIGNDVSIPGLGKLETVQRAEKTIDIPTLDEPRTFPKRPSIRFTRYNKKKI